MGESATKQDTEQTQNESRPQTESATASSDNAASTPKTITEEEHKKLLTDEKAAIGRTYSKQIQELQDKLDTLESERDSLKVEVPADEKEQAQTIRKLTAELERFKRKQERLVKEQEEKEKNRIREEIDSKVNSIAKEKSLTSGQISALKQCSTMEELNRLIVFIPDSKKEESVADKAKPAKPSSGGAGTPSGPQKAKDLIRAGWQEIHNK